MIDSQYYEAQCYIRGTSLAAAYHYTNGAKSDYTYYVQNAHGDVVNLTDADGAVTKTYHYDAFGVEIDLDTGDVNAFRFCGEYYDTESGTIYLRVRYYQAAIGRFTQRDSVTGKISDPLSLNLYTYCHNNPVYYFDASGHIATRFNSTPKNSNTLKTAFEITLEYCKEKYQSYKDKVKQKVDRFESTGIKPYVREKLINHRSGLDTMREWMSENERTFSVGNSFTFGAGLSLFSLSQCYTVDTNGNLASQWSWNLGATSSASGTLSYGYYYSITNAPSYDNLNGNGYSGGVSALAPVYGPIGVGAGCDVLLIPGYDETGREKDVQYIGEMGSILIGTVGADIHGQTGMTYTISHCHLGWLWDTYDKAYKKAINWTES